MSKAERVRSAFLAASVSIAALAGGYALVTHHDLSASAPPAAPVMAANEQAIRPAVPSSSLATLPLSAAGYGWAMDPTPLSGKAARRFSQARPLSAAWVPVRSAKLVEAPSAQILPAQAAPAKLAEASVPPRPVPRPNDLRGSLAPVPPATTSPVTVPAPDGATVVAQAPEPVRSRRIARRSQRIAAAPPAPVDTRNFLEKLFGLPASTGPATTYASLGGGTLDTPAPRAWTPVPSPSAGALTAIYDISARTVTLPSGEVLEAHSGLGAKMDDPRFVHVRMQGPTPVGTYELTEREKLFHGVRAVRMTPVGGSGAIHGRDGILAHTYMLGASGQSNGCVSFRDYDRFLQAFLRGEVRRLVVVPGQRGSAPPFFAQGAGRPAPRARDA